MNSSESIAKLAAALVGAQSEFEVVRHDSDNPFYKSKYASLGAMIESTVPILKAHGLAISQLPATENGMVGVETVLMHESGEWISNTATITLKDSPNPAQEAGKAITYLRRYGWQAVLGVYSGDDDDAQSLTQSAQKPKKDITRLWTAQQKKWLVDANYAENDFSAKAMLDKSVLPGNSSQAVIESWGKYYRMFRDDDNTSDVAAMSANGKYMAAKKGAK